MGEHKTRGRKLAVIVPGEQNRYRGSHLWCDLFSLNQEGWRGGDWGFSQLVTCSRVPHLTCTAAVDIREQSNSDDSDKVQSDSHICYTVHFIVPNCNICFKAQMDTSSSLWLFNKLLSGWCHHVCSKSIAKSIFKQSRCLCYKRILPHHLFLMQLKLHLPGKVEQP